MSNSFVLGTFMDVEIEIVCSEGFYSYTFPFTLYSSDFIVVLKKYVIFIVYEFFL